MRTVLTLILSLLLGSVRAQGHAAPVGFDKRAYYRDLSSDDPQVIDRQLEGLAEVAFPGKDAYEGAMLMRRAGQEKDAKRRMDRFRSGRQKLERMIARDSSNAEYRFLRLVIQEHVPKGVPYHADMDRDAAVILRQLDKMPVEAREAVKKYGMSSARMKAATE